MRGVSELIKEHNKRLANDEFDKDFQSFHLSQIGFLQHERLVHLIVLMFIALFSLISLSLFLILDLFVFILLFALLLILTIFYIFHYYKLENTVIEWYFVYNEFCLFSVRLFEVQVQLHLYSIRINLGLIYHQVNDLD